MYLARVNGQVHWVGLSTGYWQGWVVQGIFEVVRKFAQSKLKGRLLRAIKAVNLTCRGASG